MVPRDFLPCQISSSSISSCTELKRSSGSRSRHLRDDVAQRRRNRGIHLASGMARSCVRFTRLAMALSAWKG